MEGHIQQGTRLVNWEVSVSMEKVEIDPIFRIFQTCITFSKILEAIVFAISLLSYKNNCEAFL